MFSQKGLYVNLLKNTRNQSVEKARRAYMGQKNNKRKPKNSETSRVNSNNWIGHKTERIITSNRSQSSNPSLAMRKKTKNKDHNKSVDFAGNRHDQSLAARKTKQSINGSNHEEDKRKNERGQNCRICLLVNGKTSKEYFLVVNQTHQVRQFLLEKEKANFITIPRQLPLELAISQPAISGTFLNGQSIYLKLEQKISKKLMDNIPILSNFQLIRPIGSGGFSQVFLSRSKIDNKFYALKMIQKQMIMKNKKEKLVINERNIMVNSKHPFIVDLKYAFESEKYLIFAMEYCGGGELFGLIKKYHRLEEEVAKFYIIQILLGLQYLHSQKVVYRDIKPENILLGTDGHVKIADLGLAKPNMEERKLAYSFCGSPEYMSPQMILQEGHTYPVDYYCMGALLYELLTGLPPFYSHDPEQIYQAVISEELQFPEDINFTKQCRSLLKALLCKDPKIRLGSLYGIKEILSHPWFGKQNYQKYLNKEIEPPKNFSSIEHFTTIFQTQLNEKNKKVLDTFLRDQKKEKNDFEPLLKKFSFSRDIPQNRQSIEKKGSEKKLKTPLMYSDRRKTFQKQNQSSRGLKMRKNRSKMELVFNCLTYR